MTNRNVLGEGYKKGVKLEVGKRMPHPRARIEGGASTACEK